MKIKFSIVITTKNRLKDLQITLASLETHVHRNDVELLICDDASTDGTHEFLKQNFENTDLILNQKSKGLIANRNLLNNKAQGDYMISLDDDAQFVSDNFLEEIELFFKQHINCAVQSLRIYWGLEIPKFKDTNEAITLSKGFVGCGHVWRKAAWNNIPNYPDWFVFYGEEEFASFQLFKNNWKIYYNPAILVHHRVDVKSRKKQKDYQIRLRRSLRSGWYLYFLFFPLKEIPRRFIYTLWIQIKKKTLKGDFKATIAVVQALFDTFVNIPRLITNRNGLTKKEFKLYQNLPDTKLYWEPKSFIEQN